MNTVELRKGIYSVGVVDWDIRNFHGYITQRGATYNAYLIVDEKIALIDTVKAGFADELLARISQIIDPAKIDYLVSNHVEMDHSGATPAIMKAAPNAKLITSDPAGLKGMSIHFGAEYPYHAVKAGESISLGKRSLVFVPLPMVHWPDSMVSYCPEEKILFSNDAFGQHYASTGRFDDEVNMVEVLQEAGKYYANIVLPFGMQVQKALQACGTLDIEMIAPAHGVIWRKNIGVILDKYLHWSTNTTVNKAVVVYDSMWHSTDKMARAIIEGFATAGIPAKLLDLKSTHISDVMAEVLEAKYICVGSPTLNNNVMPSVAGFLTYMKGLAPKNRVGLAFGSYGWSGQSVGVIEDVLVKELGFTPLCEKFRICYIPSSEQLTAMTAKVTESL